MERQVCVRFLQPRTILDDCFALRRYRTLTDRLLHMRLVPARKLVKRNVSYEFMNRQMVWHAFTVNNSRPHQHIYNTLLISRATRNSSSSSYR